MRLITALALLLPLAGCASSPTPDLYTLGVVPGAQHRPTAHAIELRRIGLAGYLDRPDIVRSSANYRLDLAGNDRWGESLGGMVGRVLTEDLLQRLPGTAVFVDTGAISVTPDRVIEIDIQRFDAEADGTVVLLAQVAIRQGDGHSAAGARSVRIVRRPPTPGVAGQVAAMSAALGQLADDIAAMLGK